MLLHTSTDCDPLLDVEAALGVELRVEGNQPRLSRLSLLQLLEVLLLHLQHPLSQAGDAQSEHGDVEARRVTARLQLWHWHVALERHYLLHRLLQVAADLSRAVAHGVSYSILRPIPHVRDAAHLGQQHLSWGVMEHGDDCLRQRSVVAAVVDNRDQLGVPEAHAA